MINTIKSITKLRKSKENRFKREINQKSKIQMSYTDKKIFPRIIIKNISQIKIPGKIPFKIIIYTIIFNKLGKMYLYIKRINFTKRITIIDL